MKDSARLSFRDGGMVLPVNTPYDREVLFEYADQYARRHGRVRIEIGRRECIASVCKDQPEVCVSCGRRLDRVSYAMSARTLCRFCARRDLH